MTMYKSTSIWNVCADYSYMVQVKPAHIVNVTWVAGVNIQLLDKLRIIARKYRNLA